MAPNLRRKMTPKWEEQTATSWRPLAEADQRRLQQEKQLHLCWLKPHCSVPPSMLEGMDGDQETLGRGPSATNLEDTGPLQGRMRAGLRARLY